MVKNTNFAIHKLARLSLFLAHIYKMSLHCDIRFRKQTAHGFSKLLHCSISPSPEMFSNFICFRG